MADATVLGQFLVGAPVLATLAGLWYTMKKDKREADAANTAARIAADDRAEERTRAITASIAANQKTTDDRITAIEHATDIRFRGIEQTLGDHAGQFMPRDHIMSEFRHARQNRESAEAQLVRMHETLAGQVRDNAIAIARTTEQTALLNSGLGEVKNDLKDLRRWLGDKLDKLQAAILEKAA